MNKKNFHYSQDEAARIIQNAIRKRKNRKSPAVIEEMRKQELEQLRIKHRERLEAKEREYLFLSKLPAEAVLKLSLRKQNHAAIVLQAFWRGRRVRKMIENQTKPTKFEKSEKKSTIRQYKGPPDNFYKKIDPERHQLLVKQIRLKGSGNLDTYRNEYARFLDKQIAWEKLRLQRKSDRNEISEIFKALIQAKSLDVPLTYNVIDPTDAEIAKARKIHNSKIVDPKKWWLNLEWDNDIEAVGSNILDQIQDYKINMYKERSMELNKFNH